MRFPLLTVVPFSSFPQTEGATQEEGGDSISQDIKHKAIQHDRNREGGRKGRRPPHGVEHLLLVLEQVWKNKGDKEKEIREKISLAQSSTTSSLFPRFPPPLTCEGTERLHMLRRERGQQKQ